MSRVARAVEGRRSQPHKRNLSHPPGMLRSMHTSRTSRHPAGSTRHLYVVGSRNGPPESEAYRGMATIVGGLDVLWLLDTEPVPDEPFDWSCVEPRDREYVTAVLELSDACCDALFDGEFRTIARRILARVAAHDPRPLRRSLDAPRTAAGLVWLVFQASADSGGRSSRPAKPIWAWLGVSNASDRGRALRAAAGLVPESIPVERLPNAMILGDATLLHSRYRARLIRRRDATAEVLQLARNAVAAPPGAVAAGGRVATVISPRFGGSRPA